MTKAENIADPNSCWNKAEDDEPIFIILARDIASNETVIQWANERIRVGMNSPHDLQIMRALQWRSAALAWRNSKYIKRRYKTK